MFATVVAEYESMAHAIGPISTSLWLRDYQEYVKEPAITGFSRSFPL